VCSLLPLTTTPSSSHPNVLQGIYLIRHGNTTFDQKVDALLNPPLNEEGRERVRRAIKFLDEQQIKPRRILSSPLQRALMVAEHISRGNAQVTTHNEALPWNLGDLMGKLNTLVQPAIDTLEAYPDLRAPHGESYRTFHNRWEAFVHRVMQYAEAKPEYPIVITTHSRNIDDLQSIIGGAAVGDIKTLAPEASVTHLVKDENGSWNYTQIWDGKL
jgi:broad specificity phosphatase PhoE